MYFTGGDLDQALELCTENLPKTAAASCQNGVFMEVFNLEVLAKEKSFVDSLDPFLTCATRDTSKTICYVLVPTYMSQTLGRSFSNILDECERAEIGYE